MAQGSMAVTSLMTIFETFEFEPRGGLDLRYHDPSHCKSSNRHGRPARVRSWIGSRSNSASAAKMPNTRRLAAARVLCLPKTSSPHYAGISILPIGSGSFYTNTPLRTPDFFSARYAAPNSRQSGAALDGKPTGAAAFRAFLRHRSTRVPFLREASLHSAARQPAGTGSAQIRRNMSPNSRRVRCPSASRSQ